MKKFFFAVSLVLVTVQVPYLKSAKADFLDPSHHSKIIENIHPPSNEAEDFNELENTAKHRTNEDCKKASDHSVFSAASFYGPQSIDILTLNEFKVVEKFLNTIMSENDDIIHTIKNKYNRVRPFLRTPKVIEPCSGRLSAFGTSFPSGHASGARIQALALMELFPHYKEKILTRSEELGRSRLILGVHFPSDVQAGFEIARRTLETMKLTPEFQNTFGQIQTKIQQLSHQTHPSPGCSQPLKDDFATAHRLAQDCVNPIRKASPDEKQ